MKIIAILGLGLLAGCASKADGTIVPLQNYCQLAEPVRVSRADTRETKVQADREYRKYVAACGVPK